MKFTITQSDDKQFLNIVFNSELKREQAIINAEISIGQIEDLKTQGINAIDYMFSVIIKEYMKKFNKTEKYMQSKLAKLYDNYMQQILQFIEFKN